MKFSTKLIFATALASVIGFTIWYVGDTNYIADQRAKNDALALKVSQKQLINERNNNLRTKFKELQKERADIRDQFVELRKRLPSEENFGQFVLEMNAAAKTRKLKLDFNGQHPPYRPGINASPLVISLLTPEKQDFTGKYSLLKSFGDWLADFPQLVTVQAFSVKGDGFGPLKMSVRASMPVDIPEPGTSLD